MYTKVSRHITSSILGVFKRDHERTWFSNIIYSVPPEYNVNITCWPDQNICIWCVQWFREEKQVGNHLKTEACSIDESWMGFLWIEMKLGEQMRTRWSTFRWLVLVLVLLCPIKWKYCTCNRLLDCMNIPITHLLLLQLVQSMQPHLRASITSSDQNTWRGGD